MQTLSASPLGFSWSPSPFPSSRTRSKEFGFSSLCSGPESCTGSSRRKSRLSGLGIQAAADRGNGASFKPVTRTATASGSPGRMRLEPYGGKCGSVSFCGLTYHALDERELVSSPIKEGTGSFLWIAGPLALITSIIIPQFILSGFIEAILPDEILAEMAVSVITEGSFYFGLATFLRVADLVQKPYLEFSSKRWSLITGLRGYFFSMFFTMGLKIFVPLLAVYAAWPAVGLPAAISFAPFLAGCAAQLAFEASLSRRRSSSWPLVPIIFEVYRMYQLSRGANFVQRQMFAMRGTLPPAEFMGLFVSFQVVGVVCLWSLMTFLLRLFPSRPVAENY